MEALLDIEVFGIIEDGEINIDISVTSEDELENNLENLTLHVALKEIYHNFEHRNGLEHHYNPMLIMFPDGEGSAFDITEGETVDFEFSENMEDVGWHDLDNDNLALVAFVQDENDDILQAAEFRLVLAAPMISLSGWTISDESGGDGDLRAEAGETVDLTVTIMNHPLSQMLENLNITITTVDPAIELLENSFELASLDPGASADNSDSPFRLTIAEIFETHPVEFMVSVNANDGEYEGSFGFSVMFGWPDVLTVDASNGNRNAVEIVDHFDGDALPYADRWDRAVQGSVSDDLFANYKAVLWHSADEEMNIMSSGEEESLMEFLDEGGALMISSPKLITGGQDRELLNDYMSVRHNSRTEEREVSGDDEDVYFGDIEIILAGEGEFMRLPTLTAEENGTDVLYYAAENDEVAAVAGVADNYRTLFFAFPFEAVAVDEEYDDLSDLLVSSWNWLSFPMSVPDVDNIPYGFTLGKAYPNPFNSVTVIPFYTNVSIHAEFSIYDSSGRLVLLQDKGQFGAGRHNLFWDAIGITAGTYYAIVKTDRGSVVSKVTLLK